MKFTKDRDKKNVLFTTSIFEGKNNIEEIINEIGIKISKSESL